MTKEEYSAKVDAMHNVKDKLFSAMVFLAAVALALVGWRLLSRPVDLARGKPDIAMPTTEDIPVANVHLETPTPTLEPEEAALPYIYDPAIPLPQELQAVLCEVCEEAGVPIPLILGVIEVESCFLVDADNGQCYGLMQLNRDYFPDKLSPADNLRAGIEYLGRLLEQYGDTAAALTAYNAGYDTGRRSYADAVIAAAEWWAAEK